MNILSFIRRHLNVSFAPNQRFRRLAFELLEDKSLLSTTDFALTSMVRNVDNDCTYVESIVPIIPDESYDVEYELLSEGRVRVLGQTGIQYLSSYTYCAPRDQIYIKLWEKALTRWEEVITVGAPDIVYPYEADDQSGIAIDDIYLYFGFSDSFTNSSSLGSSLNAGFYRDNGLGLAATGSLVFNAKYFTESPNETVQNVFYNTALHELAHALGYNLTHLENLNLLEYSVSAPYELNDVFTTASNYWYYIGEKGVEQYSLAFPESIQALSTSKGFLMETYTASGSYAAHPSSLLGTYYLYLNQRDGMNYSISPSFKATITATTLGIFEDLGYQVDYDFADSFDSPTPIDLEATIIGSSVILNWSKSLGDFSTSANQVSYSVQRCDLLDSLSSHESSRSWQTIATGLTALQYRDLNLVPGKEYLYRVVANNVRTNTEIGVFKAKAGDQLFWDDVANKYCVYALTNKGSNALTWSRVVSSTTETNWTVTSLSQTPINGVTLFRVVAIGSSLDATKPSKAIDVSISTAADKYVPDGYSRKDWNALRTFLETSDSFGIKNGVKIHGDAYSSDFLESFPGICWTKIDNEYRLTQIIWNNYELTGTLNLSDCSELLILETSNNKLSAITLARNCKVNYLDVSHNSISELSVPPTLHTLICNNNKLQTIALAKCYSLAKLDCSQNSLTSLDLSDCLSIQSLQCSLNPINFIDCSANTQLSLMEIWNETLLYVTLPLNYSGTVDVSIANAGHYSWSYNNQIISEKATCSQWNNGGFQTELTMAFNDKSQSVVFYSGDSDYKPHSPSNFSFGILENECLQTSWVDEANNETGYLVFYSIDNNVWKQAADLPSSPLVSTSTGASIYRQATKVKTGHIYSFRVYAYKKTAIGEVLLSSPLEASINLTITPIVTITGDPIPLIGRTLSLSTNIEASTYEVQWFRIDANNQSTPIPGATELTYSPTTEDLGSYLRGVITQEGMSFAKTSNAVVASATLKSPEELEFGAFLQGNVPMSWIDLESTELGYKVFYQVEGEDWKLAETIVSTPERSSSVGNHITRVATQIQEQKTYSFTVLAYAFDATGAITYSEPISMTYALTLSLSSPTDFQYTTYDLQKENLNLKWTSVKNALYYEVQYNTESSGWLTSEITEQTQRTARNVHQNQIYNFRVRALGLNGAISDWRTISYPKEQLSPPETILASNYNINTQTLSLSWSIVDSAESYLVEYRRANTQLDLKTQAWAIAECLEANNRTAHKVYPDMYYQFRIRSNSQDAKYFSAWKTVTISTFSYTEPSDLIDIAFAQIQDYFNE